MCWFQHTAARRRLVLENEGVDYPKEFQHTAARRRLATVPGFHMFGFDCFNTQPPEGGWGLAPNVQEALIVSTHSRPKAAGPENVEGDAPPTVSTHSRPKAAGAGMPFLINLPKVSTHSRPKAAGYTQTMPSAKKLVSTHSRPKAAGNAGGVYIWTEPFQHTAARRRLVGFLFQSRIADRVSTHSRPKAAGKRAVFLFDLSQGFNTQPPEGGWGAGI